MTSLHIYQLIKRLQMYLELFILTYKSIDGGAVIGS
jgi:hypothetical protein